MEDRPATLERNTTGPAESAAVEPLAEDRASNAELIGELRRLRVLAEVADTVTRDLSLDLQLPRLIDLITQSLDAERATLFLYDRDTGALFSRVLSGEGVAEIRIPANVGIAGGVFSAGVAEIIPDVYRDRRFNPEIDRQTGYRTRNILCMPLK